MLEIRLKGERVVMHAEGALHWVRARTLVIADPHFGKDDVFRRAGIAIPRGPTMTDLQRLSRLLERTSVERLLVVGDLVHGASEPGDDLLRQFAFWHRRHRELDLRLVAGNHDRHEDWRRWTNLLTLVPDTMHEAPFVFSHAPEPDPRGYVIAGHLHPVFAHPALGPRALRTFWRRRHALVLPSFGEFTGGARIEAAPADGLYACTPEGVLAIREGEPV